MTEGEVRAGKIPWPPLIYLVALLVGIALGVVYPLPWFTDILADILFAIGWLIVLAVVTLWVTAIRAMTKAKTTLNPNGIPDRLLTGGAFAISRNPIYLANTLLLVAIGLITGSLWFLIVAVLAAFATRKLTIEREEKTLARKFGKKYHDYAKRVRRWI